MTDADRDSSEANDEGDEQTEMEADRPDRSPKSTAPLQLSRRRTLAGIGGGLGLFGLGGSGIGASAVSATPTTAAPVVQAVAAAQIETAARGTTAVGNGALAVHDGAFVIGDSSPSQITSQGPDEVRSQMPIYAPAFHTTSARAAKTDVEPVDPERILDSVESLPVSRWRFTDVDDGYHVGPMAEDFHEAFDLEGDGETIATVDADGVALAAIQGLLERLESEHDQLIHELEQRRDAIDELEARLDAIDAEGADE